MAESTPLSLAEVMAAMSIAVDIGMGQPLEQGLGVCLLAVRFGEALGLDENDLQAIFEIALLRHIGCTAETVDFASIMGDELLARATGGPFVDWASPSAALRFLAGHIARTHSPGRALYKIVRLPGAIPIMRAGAVAVCEVANLLAGRFGMPDRTRAELTTVYERWDGKGFPGRLSGEAIPRRPFRSAVAWFSWPRRRWSSPRPPEPMRRPPSCAGEVEPPSIRGWSRRSATGGTPCWPRRRPARRCGMRRCAPSRARGRRWTAINSTLRCAPSGSSPT
jgi:hypothetical protein